MYKKRELSSHKGELTRNTNVQYLQSWQPSLVLGRLGEALNGPHGSQEPYPNLLALQAY